MLISRRWLSDFVEFEDLTTEEFSELVTTRVAEVDKVHAIGAPADAALVARIVTAAPHPRRADLQVATVQTGAEELQIVCGAPNCKADTFAAYVPPGGSVRRLASGADAAGEPLLAVDAREVDGVLSQGILVSEAELGLTGDHRGLLLIDDAAGSPGLKPGTPLAALYGGSDTVLEIDNKSLTHRPDLWCHFGFAREIASILGRPLRLDIDRFADDTPSGSRLLAELGRGEPGFQVKIDPESGCRRFIAIEIGGVEPVASPLWLRRRLFTVGAGVRNLLVDLSNYVMLDIGQPNHAYDADALEGSTIEVRAAEDGEIFLGLDGERRTLGTQDIVIADQSGAIALGGVIGGGPTAVSEKTTRVLLESANFDPIRIRQTCKQHQIRTDASNRFEKSLSPFSAPVAIHRYCELLFNLLPGATALHRADDAFVSRPARVTVPFRADYIRSRIGAEIPDTEIQRILSALGFARGEGEERAMLVVPYYRATRDISIEDDLVEEVGRIFGYENVPERAPEITSVAAPARPVHELEYRIRDSLRGAGFSEIYNYSFMSPDRAELLGYPVEEAVRVLNAVDANAGVVRTSLVPAMIDAAERNSRYRSSLLLYELGRTYHLAPDEQHLALQFRAPVHNPAAFERRLLCLGYSSGEEEGNLHRGLRPVLAKGADFYAVRTILAKLVNLVTSSAPTLEPLTDDGPSAAGRFQSLKRWMHPHRAAAVRVGERTVGVIAEVGRQAAPELAGRMVIAEIDVELLLSASSEPRAFRAPSKFPSSLFELSVVMPQTAYYADLEAILRASVPAGSLRSLEVVAVYQGAPLEVGQKSVSVKMTFGSDARTLSSEELTDLQQNVMGAIAASPYYLRS